MKLEITQRKSDPFLKREMVTFTGIVKGATPGRMALKKEMAQALHTKPELVQVRKIDSTFGAQSFSATALIYKDAQSLARLEPEKYKKKNNPEQKEEGAEKKSEEKKSTEKKEEPHNKEEKNDGAKEKTKKGDA